MRGILRSSLNRVKEGGTAVSSCRLALLGEERSRHPNPAASQAGVREAAVV
jgi:hypothetical protein